MAPLGKPKRRIRIEPMPGEAPRRQPAPVREPVREPAPEPKRREKVPA
jgi:hypothetical protein